ncbi:uncharacterized protein CCR75_005030 [Bremia lactucae]|uniref:CHK kinase-like domain-containing protein n=1 Tax=Bremia lactucae TaxID=4779 RepID=A0A976FE02_BRELC|nr:hypothetical protein CCR75_005030 [Bremia lactucae]
MQLLEIPKRPSQLTTKFLQEILIESYPLQRVLDFQWKPMNAGVIAEVVVIAIVFKSLDENDKSKRNTRHFVGKFMRPELPFDSMFRVESFFYKNFVTKLVSASISAEDFPFAIPSAIFTSNGLIVLECVENMRTHMCVKGSPPHLTPMLLTKLAKMHARFWNDDCDGLASPAGIGSQLTGEEKCLQFPSCWKDFLDDVSLKRNDKEKLTALCQRLCQNSGQLILVHELVNSGPSCLIHGDFHIENMLLTADGTENGATWLLDWATCGKGNPLRDVAFFFIVSVRASDRRAQEARCLEIYYKALIAESNVVSLSQNELYWQYKMCVLNQFLILVVYDSLSKSFATNAKTDDSRKQLESHFREVNYRMCLSVLDNFCEKDLNLLESHG